MRILIAEDERSLNRVISNTQNKLITIYYKYFLFKVKTYLLLFTTFLLLFACFKPNRAYI